LSDPLAAPDLLGRSSLKHLAEMENEDMLRNIEHYVHIVLDEEKREAGIESHEKLCHLAGLAR
jgi:hypothetical protein